jgi:death-on-curing protein
MITLDKEQVKRLHKLIADNTGGSDGIRDEGLLESALFSPFQTFGGAELYPSTTAKIAKSAYNLVCNHPFIDGNKRIGVLVMLVLLELNQIGADFTDETIVRLGLGLAKGEVNYNQLLDLILENSK